MGFEIVNHYHSFATALGFFPPQNNPSIFSRRLVFFNGRICGAVRQTFQLKGREGRLESGLVAGGIEALLHQGAKNGGRR